MKTLGNLLWFLLVGIWTALTWFLVGIVWCITIIGIPFGKQCFKLAKLAAWPFGHDASICFESHPIANVLWLIFGGLEFCLGYVFAGVILCITIIGIPFGKQCFKLAKLALFPFGATVN